MRAQLHRNPASMNTKVRLLGAALAVIALTPGVARASLILGPLIYCQIQGKRAQRQYRNHQINDNPAPGRTQHSNVFFTFVTKFTTLAGV